MTKDILTLLFTGPPCSGKTSTIEALKSRINPLSNYNVVFLPEVATEVLPKIPECLKSFNKSGIQQFYLYECQRLLFEEIIQISGYCREGNKKVMIVFDRGMPDVYAYATNVALLITHGKTPEQLLQDYEVCVYFESRPREQLEKVLREDKSTPRSEDVDGIMELNKVSLEIYSRHPRFYSVPFFSKQADKVKCVSNLLNDIAGEIVFL